MSRLEFPQIGLRVIHWPGDNANKTNHACKKMSIINYLLCQKQDTKLYTVYGYCNHFDFDSKGLLYFDALKQSRQINSVCTDQNII